uniref:Interferon regulatory factor 7 n=1 Tax=Myripristis murdjan TaxID=586833 RepID=A0A668AZE8_9TELE
LHSPPKPQFANWLIEQVQTGQYKGLCYVEQNKFRVPWKHNSRKDCNDEDSKIFRAWAVASGKINEFPNDKAKWKTNFRCALNNLTKRFKMVSDNSKNSEDPHKIYEIINTEYNYESQQTDDSPDDFDIYSSPIEYLPSGTEVEYWVQPPHCKEQQWTENYGQQPAAVPVSYPAIQPAAAEPLPGSGTHTQPPIYCPNPEPVFSSPPQPSIYDLEISIHYRKREMLKFSLRSPRVQLHYQQEAPELNAQPICFPTTAGLLDRKQIEYTERILNSIQRGLLLEVRDTGIYACRQDRCHVFASTNDPSVAHPDPRKLPPNTMIELLSFEKYVNELKQFKENNGGSPDYTINMCFGEKFPDGKPLEKKLIVVKVVPLICRHFHEMAQLEGASSLHSANVSLQISHNSLYDLINSVFSLPIAEDPLQVF